MDFQAVITKRSFFLCKNMELNSLTFIIIYKFLDASAHTKYRTRPSKRGIFSCYTPSASNLSELIYALSVEAPVPIYHSLVIRSHDLIVSTFSSVSKIDYVKP